MTKSRRCILVLWLSAFVTVAAADEYPTEPLLLSNALSLADKPHPSTIYSELDVEEAKINSRFYDSYNQLNLTAELVPQRVDRAAPNTGGTINDSYATLRLSHPLYDFGRRSSAKSRANVDLEKAQHNLEYVQAQRRIEIMRRYFDVLVADLDYGVKNEKMTLGFLVYNRYQEEMELYQTHAEVDVLQLETNYRELFLVREEARINRVRARRSLGLVLGFSDYVPRDLVAPDVSVYVEREVPEFEDLLEQVLQNNFHMKQAEFDLQRAMKAAEESKSKYNPQLDAVLEATEWRRETGSRNSTSIGIRFTVPLASGEHKNRDRRKGEIAIQRAQAQFDETEFSVRQRTFDLWKALTLHHVDLAAADVRLNFRDQYMDRARTLYELEERSDLGDAQAELLRALLENDRVRYELTLTWSEIDALMGNPVYPY